MLPDHRSSQQLHPAYLIKDNINIRRDRGSHMDHPARNDFTGTVVVQSGTVGLKPDLRGYQRVAQW